MNAQRIGELGVFLGVIVVVISLAAVFDVIEMPLDGENLAWVGVAAIIIGEAFVLKG